MGGQVAEKNFLHTVKYGRRFEDFSSYSGQNEHYAGMKCLLLFILEESHKLVRLLSKTTREVVKLRSPVREQHPWAHR